MPDAQPTMEMSSALGAADRADAPNQQPGASDTARPCTQGDPGARRLAGGTPPDMQATPSLPISGGVAVAVGAWQTSKKVDSLWTINQDRNSWVGIAGIGWKKLAGPNE